MRTALLILAVTLCASLAACTVRPAYEGAPDDMRPINDGSDGAILYVPSSWAVDTSTGVPTGYVSADNRTTVTLVHVDAETVGDKTVPEYWAVYRAQFEAVISDFSVVKESEEGKDYNTRIIAERDAYEYEFTGTVTGLSYRFRQTLLKGADGGLFIITYSAYEDNFNTHLETLTEQIYGNFRFVTDSIPVKDDNTLEPGIDGTVTPPEGMKLISNQVVDYCLFVPEAWKEAVNTGFTAAVSPNCAGVAVNASAFSCEFADYEAFWASHESELKATFGEGALSYKGESKYTDIKLNGYDARTYGYTLTRGGKEYSYSQTVLLRNGYVYMITCSADSESFSAYEADFSRIISEFRFK